MNRVTARVAVADFDALAAVEPEVLYIVGVEEPVSNQVACPAGNFVSEGDTQLAVATARSANSVDGTGITVGILSDSFARLSSPTSAAGDVTAADLPGTTNPCGFTTPVNVQTDLLSSGADEGRAMGQIVHDLAPGANIAYSTAFGGEAVMAANIRALAAAGAKVIVDDITYFAEPMFQDGVIGQAVEDVTAAGVTYFSSAGNTTTYTGAFPSSMTPRTDTTSYEAAAYRPTTCPAAVITALGASIDCHNFNASGPADSTYSGTSTNGGRWLLGWSEPQNGITTDLTLFFLDGVSGAILSSGTTNQLAGGKAFQSVSVSGGGSDAIVIARRNPTTGGGTPRVKLISFRGSTTTIQPVQAPDIVGPSIFGHNAGAIGGHPRRGPLQRWHCPRGVFLPWANELLLGRCHRTHSRRSDHPL